jgi:hypothetical protein
MTAEPKGEDVKSAEAEKNPSIPVQVPDTAQNKKTDRITALQDGVGE